MKTKLNSNLLYLSLFLLSLLTLFSMSVYAETLNYGEIVEGKIPVKIEIIDKTGKNIYSHLRLMIYNNLKTEINNSEYNGEAKERSALFKMYVLDLKQINLKKDYIVGSVSQPLEYESIFIKNPFYCLITSDKNTAQPYITIVVVYTVQDGQLVLNITRKNNVFNTTDSKEFSFLLNDFTLFEDLKLLCSTKIKSFVTKYLYVSLSVSSNETAYVEVNGTIVGKTNNDFSVKAGPVKIRVFKNGYDDFISNAKIEKDTKITVNLTIAQKQYTLKIDTFPMNADIYINGDYIGKSPLIVL